jgi:ATP-binding cassette subfamily B (MDR/TAP) protein 1
LVPEAFYGIFKFQHVSFAYPKDKTKNILNNFSCEINAANSGLVGNSGCGKSTVFQLMMRYYDPDEGYVSLDGNDLRKLDLDWLRKHIGYVGQEPVLFATSIK